MEFTQEQKGLQVIQLEEENLILHGERWELRGDVFYITGKAEIDGEIYHEFCMAFQPKPLSSDLETAITGDWDWYDFVF